MIVPRTLGLPFRGYDAAHRRWMAPLNVITEASQDWLIDPTEGKLIRRGGSYLCGQFIKDANEVTLQFESGPTYGDLYARQVIELSSDAITDGLPTHAVLYSNDATAGLLLWMSPNTYTVANCSMVINTNTLTTATANGFEDVTLGCRVQVPGLNDTAQVITINSTTSLALSMETDATITTQTATIGGPLHGINTFIGKTYSGDYPGDLKVIAIAGVTNILRQASERALVAMGSRRAVQLGDFVIMGNGFTGHVPMKWNKDWNDRQSTGTRNQKYLPAGNIPPLFLNVATGTTSIAGSEPQFKADTVAFFSIMYRHKDGSFSQPFIPKDIVVPVGAATFHGRFDCRTACDALTITLPVGPADVTARYVLRTIFTTSPLTPALVDEQGNSLLGIAAIIENNTQTSYSLTVGRDTSLVYDPTIVRFDRFWMPPTKYLWTGDQRVWGINLKPPCQGILICNIGITGQGEDYNPSTTWGVTCTGSAVDATVYDAGWLTPGTGIAIVLTGKTLDQVVTEINQAVGTSVPVGSSWGFNYRAQLAPGADPGALATLLKDISAINFIGGGSPGAGVMPGNNEALPALLVMGSAYTAAQSSFKRRVWFTEGSPGLPPYSLNVPPKNFREAPAHWGFGVGGAPLLDGQVVCFSNAIGTCRNIRDGKTGLDDDYRLEPLNENRGCISDASIVSGDGWVGYMTLDGYVVTDGVREVIISGSGDQHGGLYNPATRQGILAGPIQNCQAALGTNDGEACARYISAWLEGSKLCLGLSYAATSPSTADDPVLVYDFSAGAPGSGLAEVLRPDGTPWGWSAPQGYGPRFPGTRAALVGGTIGRLKDSDQGRRVVVASAYLSTAAPTVPHGIIARIFEPTGTDLVHLDQDGTTHAATATSGSANLTAVAGDLSRIAVGATVIEVTGSNIRRGSTVSSVSGTTVVMNRTAKATGASTVIFHGKDIEPAAYLATDMVGTMNMKSLRSLWAFYNQAGTGMEVQVTNELDRTGQVTFALPAAASADGFNRQRLNPTQALRGLSKAYEALVVDRGTTTQQSEFWGMEVEVEVLESHR